MFATLIPYISAQLPDLYNITFSKKGGQKIVFRAEHKQYGTVAVKLIENPSSDQRILREIQLAIDCHFKNVPQVYESGYITLLGNQHLYMLEQFVVGETLQERLNRDKTIPLSVALDMLENLLIAATELESSHLVHRDIKPANIMIGTSGEFWLLDFGIARDLGEASLTDTADVLGPHTPGYSAPEQFRNRKSEVDIRTDLFAIGLVCYEALSGAHPFLAGARTAATVRHRTETLQLPPLQITGDTQGELSRFIQALTDKFVSRRPKDAQTALRYYHDLLPTMQP